MSRSFVELQRSRALDIEVAVKVMGLMHDPDGKLFQPSGSLYSWHLPGVPVSEERKPYSTDLNACAEAEARVVEMGLGEAYLAAMSAQHGAVDVSNPVRLVEGMNSIMLYCLTAPAEARCRAMLRALAGREK